jgi:protein TonB
MKQVFFHSLFFLLFSFSSEAQTTVADSTTPIMVTTDGVMAQAPPGDKIFVVVEQEAMFPGGNEAWMSFLQKHLKSNIGEKNKAPKGRYRVVAKFIVNKEGKVTNITVESNNGFGMEEEVVRVLQKSPNWLPAQQSGKKVNAYRRQPITFIVN